MGISNGELANETNFNKSFLDKNTDTETVNKISLRRPASGADVEDVQQDINTNKSNISTNATNISTNAGNIATNTSDISTNAGNISTNTSNISTNTANISTNATDIQAIEDDYGVANGLATLDGGGKVPASQLPETLLEYLGTWDADTNTPTLSDATGSTGNVYLVNVAGTQDLGSGPITFDVGDWAIHNGSVWQKSLNSNAVISVFGRLGAVVAQSGDYNADQVDETATRYFDVKNNRNASVDPTVNDDSTSNYVVGSTWFNSTDSKTFICQDNTAGSAVWVEFSGGGSGVGGKDIYALFDAEDEDVDNFTNISVTSSNPINQNFSYSVDSFPADFGAIALNNRNKGRENGVSVRYTLASGTAKLVVKDNSSNIIGETEISASSSSKPAFVSYYVDTSYTSVLLEVQDVSSATACVIDDVTFTDEPLRYTTLKEDEVVKYYGFSANGSDGRVRFSTLSQDSSDSLISHVSSDSTIITFKETCNYIATASYIGVNSSEYIIEVRDETGTLVDESRDSSASNGVCSPSASGIAYKDWTIKVFSSQTPNNSLASNLTVTAKRAIESIITPTKSGFIEEKILTGDDSTSGGSDVSALQFNNLVIGRRYVITGQVAYKLSAYNTAAFAYYSGAGASGELYGRVKDTDDASSGGMERMKNVFISFVASSTSAYFRFSNNAGSTTLQGNNTKEETFLQLNDFTGEFLAAIPTNINGKEYDISSKLSGTGWTINNAYAVYRQTSNNSHWIDITINGTRASSTLDSNLVLSGVAPSFGQALASTHGPAGSASSAYVDNTGNFFISSTVATTVGFLSGSIRLDSKPTWAV